ncbi:MAG: alkaline phosphatase family protein [Sandaracinaceae bacterium]
MIVVGLAGTALAVLAPPLHELGHLAGAPSVRVLARAPSSKVNGPHVLVFALDGVGRDAFHEWLGTDNAASRLAGRASSAGPTYEHACEVDDALSILPSTTVPAWTSALTGVPIAVHGVSGNEWFVREERRFVAPAPVSVEGDADTLRALNDGLIGDAVDAPTVFERVGVRSHVSLHPVYRGASVYTIPDASDVGDVLARFSHGLVGADDDPERELYASADLESVDTLLEAIDAEGLPALQLIYFPGIDMWTHEAPHPLEGQQAYLREVTAPAVERVLDAYRRRGALDHTSVIFVSDHGHTPVLDDDRHALGVGEDDEPTHLLEQLGFRVRGASLEEESDDFSAVVAYQGAFAYVYLADRSTCPQPGQPCDWTRPPRLEQDVLPVASAFASPPRRGPLAYLADAIDLVLTRVPHAAGEPSEAFGVYDEGEIVPVDAWLRAHPRPELLRLAPRLAAMSEGPHGDRVGDVALLARAGSERPIEERYYFSHPYRSWHGSPAASDSRITFTVMHPHRTGSALCAEVLSLMEPHPSLVQLTPVIERLLADRPR